MGGHIGATWRIWLNCPSAAPMRSFLRLLWPLAIVAIIACIYKPRVVNHCTAILSATLSRSRSPSSLVCGQPLMMCNIVCQMHTCQFLQGTTFLRQGTKWPWLVQKQFYDIPADWILVARLQGNPLGNSLPPKPTFNYLATAWWCLQDECLKTLYGAKILLNPTCKSKNNENT